MLIYSPHHGKFIIDPHYWTIIPFKAIRDADKSKDKVFAEAQVMWIYHMYSPHSPFKEYKKSSKSDAIVQSTFPKGLIEVKQKERDEDIRKAMPASEEEKQKQLAAEGQLLKTKYDP